MECLGFNFSLKDEETIMIGLCKSFENYNINNEIISETIFLRKQYKIKLPDAIIAATALVNNWILVTINTKDFEKIKNLKFINPMI